MNIFNNKWIFTSLLDDNKNINLKNTSIIENNYDCDSKCILMTYIIQ